MRLITIMLILLMAMISISIIAFYSHRALLSLFAKENIDLNSLLKEGITAAESITKLEKQDKKSAHIAQQYIIYTKVTTLIISILASVLIITLLIT